MEAHDEPGMAYMALSRGRGRDALCLASMDLKVVRADSRLVELWSDFKLRY